jgi:ABC-type uncharacterized transport system fused permease/ATPase subunit
VNAAWESSWSWSLSLIAVTIAMHVTGVVLLANGSERIKAKLPQLDISYLSSVPVSMVLIVGVALCLAVLHGLEAIVWALSYVHLGALPSLADATLYSLDSMTSRGGSGLLIEERWRMMGAAEAADGMLLFGISTAFVFAVMARIWKKSWQAGP